MPHPNTIYFAKIPNLQDLCTVSLQVSSDSPGISNISQFGSQPQIIKCRELIFTEPNVLASPSLQERGLIFVIIQQSFWKTGKLQARCQKSGLKMSKPTRAIPAVFQACLSYTLKAKLAPLWNKAGDLYIQGRNFLTMSTKANAVGIEINVTDAEICIALKPTIVKMSQSDLRDFEIAPGVLDHFFASTSNFIPEYAIDDKWCHILPSLKKGKLVSVTHQIPAVSPFKTYKDIRRYWKNAYGYRLPESDSGMFYYNIYFPAIGNTLFTYPDFCVFKREPVLLPRADPAAIIPAFLTDVKAKLPSICGFPFEVNPKAQYATTGLYQASIQNNSLSSLSLTQVPPQYHNYPIRQMPTQPLPQHNRPTLPNRALAKSFDAAFQQASARTQPNQSLPSHHVPVSPRSSAFDASQADRGHTSQHGVRPPYTNLPSHPIPATPITPRYSALGASPGMPSGVQLGRGQITQHEAQPARLHIPASPITPRYSALGASPSMQSESQQFGTGQTPQHKAHPQNTNMPSLQIPASPITPRYSALGASPGMQSASQLGNGQTPQHEAHPQNTNIQSLHIPASPTAHQSGGVDTLSPGVQLSQYSRGQASQLGVWPLNTNMPTYHIPASPITHQSGVADTPSPGVQPHQLDRGHTPHGGRPLSRTNIPRLQPRAILPASPTPAPLPLQRRLIYQSPPAGMSPAPTRHHQGHPQSPYTATQHTAIHHSPLMSNSAAQHPPRLYPTIPSPQSIQPSNHNQQQFAHPGQVSQNQLMIDSSRRSFQFPTSPPPQMLTPVPQQSPVAVAARIVPSFRPHKARNLACQPQGPSQTTRVIPAFKPAVKRSITPTFAAKVQLNFDIEPTEQQAQVGGATPAQLESNDETSQQTLMKPSFGAKTPSTAVGNVAGKPSKRHAKGTDGEPTPKRQRSKPKVQDVDMQALMLNDQLSKVNTVTLVTWLKNKNIKVKSREKKPDLIAKVVDFIKAKSKEN